MYNAGGLDITFLGMAQIAQDGKLNIIQEGRIKELVQNVMQKNIRCEKSY